MSAARSSSTPRNSLSLKVCNRLVPSIRKQFNPTVLSCCLLHRGHIKVLAWIFAYSSQHSVQQHYQDKSHRSAPIMQRKRHDVTRNLRRHLRTLTVGHPLALTVARIRVLKEGRLPSLPCPCPTHKNRCNSCQASNSPDSIGTCHTAIQAAVAELCVKPAVS
jgi:hypothetical protein